MQQLLEIMQQLRDPEKGCPWDVEQDFSTIAPYTIEEAYEVADAIARGDMDDLKDELGDLFFVLVNFGRMLGADCEESLRQGNNKFERRFKGIERALKSSNTDIKDASLAQMEALWIEEKKKERKAS